MRMGDSDDDDDSSEYTEEEVEGESEEEEEEETEVEEESESEEEEDSDDDDEEEGETEARKTKILKGDTPDDFQLPFTKGYADLPRVDSDADWLFKPSEDKIRLGIFGRINADLQKREKSKSYLSASSSSSSSDDSDSSTYIDSDEEKKRVEMKHSVHEEMRTSLKLQPQPKDRILNMLDMDPRKVNQRRAKKKSSNDPTSKSALDLDDHDDSDSDDSAYDDYNDSATLKFLKENSQVCKLKCEFKGLSSIVDQLAGQGGRTAEPCAVYPLTLLVSLGASPQTLTHAYATFPEALEENDSYLGTPLHYALHFLAPYHAIQWMIDKVDWCNVCELKSYAQDRLPLHVACSISETDPKIVALIAEEYNGAVTETDSQGMTPLHYACSHRNASVEMVQALTKITRDCVLQTNPETGETPLHLALQNKAPLDVIKVLVNCNSRVLNIATKTSDGSAGVTPLTMPLSYDPAVTKFLKSAAAADDDEEEERSWPRRSKSGNLRTKSGRLVSFSAVEATTLGENSKKHEPPPSPRSPSSSPKGPPKMSYAERMRLKRQEDEEKRKTDAEKKKEQDAKLQAERKEREQSAQEALRREEAKRKEQEAERERASAAARKEQEEARRKKEREEKARRQLESKQREEQERAQRQAQAAKMNSLSQKKAADAQRKIKAKLNKTEFEKGHELPPMARVAAQKKTTTTSNAPAAVLDSVDKFYSVDELRAQSVPGLDYKNREKYLSDADFQELFKCTKEEFAKWPKWKATKAKRSLKLF